MRILFDNKTKTASLISSDADPNYPVDNLKSPFLKKRFQATGSRAVVEMSWGTPISVDSIFIGYTNCHTVRVRLYLAGLFQGQWLVADAVSFAAVQADSAYIDLDVDGEKVVNGNFADGATGWTLGTGARVRQQGWVAKLGSLDTVFFTSALSFVASPGQTGALTAIANWGTLSATNLDIYLQFSDAGGANLGRVNLLWTSADLGYVQKSGTLVAPVNTAFARLVVNINGYVSGDCYVGFVYGTVNDVTIVTNWDFADGSTGWSNVGANVITYDPANAYMGNAMPGGSGNTMVIQDDGTAGIEANTQTWPAVAGQQFSVSLTAKPLASPTTDGTFRLRWQTSVGGLVATTDFVVSKDATDWVTTTQTVTCPANPTISRVWFDYLSQTGDYGLWLIGSVSVSRVLTTPAYLGGIGIGSAYYIDPPQSFWDETFDDRSIVSESDGGQVLQEYTAPLRVYQFSIPTLTRGEARACEALYIQCGRGRTIWLDPETDDLPPLYCSLVDALTINKNKRQYTARLNFREAR